MNQKNNTEDLEENYTHSTLDEVLSILNLSNESVEIMAKKLSKIESNQRVSEILKIDKKQKSNKALAKYAIAYQGVDSFKDFSDLFNDSEIVSVALAAGSNNFQYISDALKKDIEIGKIMIISLINEDSDYLVIQKFIERNFGKDKKNKSLLEKYYKKTLNKTQDFIQRDINITFFDLQKNNKSFIEELFSRKIILTQGKNIQISPEFYKNISEKLSSDSIFQKLYGIKKEKYLDNHIISELQVPDNIPHNQVKFLIDLIKKSLNIQKQKKKITEKNNIDETLNKSQKKENIGNNKEGNGNVNNTEKFSGDDTNIIDYSLPECNYSYYSGYYHVEVFGDKTIDIKESELENFTSIALNNFVKFYAMLHNIGLAFLWDKYEIGFTTLCSNKVGFDYQRGEGITEGKSLAILNVIGKSIGVPEDKNSLNPSPRSSVLPLISKEDNMEDDLEKKEIKIPKCFNTLADARMIFGDITSIGKINGVEIMEPGTFSSYSVVEKYMIQHDLIDVKGGGLNLSKF